MAANALMNSPLEQQVFYPNVAEHRESVDSRLERHLFYPDSKEYHESVDSYWAGQETELKPAAVLQPDSVAALASGVALLRKVNLASNYHAPFAVRSGGHGLAFGVSNIGSDGVTIDLRRLKKLSISDDKSFVTVGAGNTFEDVYKYLEPQGLCVPGARVAQVGVAGFLLGGGISYYSPATGLACDNVKEFEVVAAVGTVLRANCSQNKDLYKALKGGGNNFGIVTSFTMKTVPLEAFWESTTTNNIANWSKSAEWFHGQLSSPFKDDKAALTIMLCNLQGNPVMRQSLKYTSPQPNMDIFKGALDLPSLQSTTRQTSITDLTIEDGKQAASGQRRLFRTCSFKSNVDMLERMKPLWLESLKTVEKLEGLEWSLICDPVSADSTSDNVTSLSASDGTIIVLSLYAGWANASDDAIAAKAGKALMDKITQQARDLRVFHPYIYMNFAAQDQRVVEGYGSQSKEFMEGVSRTYDPEGIFQKAVIGGFKINA